MEASKFGFWEDTPAARGFKFDPTDADIVASYLLPRALGQRSAHEHAIIDDNPARLPPWELMAEHGHAGSPHAFFFVRGSDNGGRMVRTIKAVGKWSGQKSNEAAITLLADDGRELEVRYKCYNLSFKDTDDKCTGWVMHEYSLLSPPLPGTMLCRIRNNNRQEEEEEPKAAGAGVGADQQLLLDPEQPGPSHQYRYHAGHVAGDNVVMGDGQGFGGALSDFGFAHGVGETGGDYYSNYFTGGGDGYSNYFNAAGGDDSMYYYGNDGDVKFEPYDGQ